MGGFGSGRRRWKNKATLEHSMVLDIPLLFRKCREGASKLAAAHTLKACAIKQTGDFLF
jgi:hypothetical protein